MEEFLRLSHDLKNKMWITSGSRFAAAHRLFLRQKLTRFSIALLSVVAIAVGLLDPQVSAAASAAGIGGVAVNTVIAVFILVISLIDGGSGSAVRATQLHENAIVISEVRSRLEASIARWRADGSPHWDQLDAFRTEYEQLIRECPINHSEIDYRRFQADHRKSPEFLAADKTPRMNWLEGQMAICRYAVNPSWLPFVSWFVVLALIVFVIDWSSFSSSPSS